MVGVGGGVWAGGAPHGARGQGDRGAGPAQAALHTCDSLHDSCDSLHDSLPVLLAEPQVSAAPPGAEDTAWLLPMLEAGAGPEL